ncbi:hypothetical protein ACVBEJ_11260 [Porticoccus sp. GXU_MW_L64]
MDFQFIRELLLALYEEFKTYRKLFVAFFVVILVTFLGVAKFWPDKYVATALIQADRKSTTADLLRNQAVVQEAPPARIAQQLFHTRLILTETVTGLGEISSSTLPEEVNRAVGNFSGLFTTRPVISTRTDNVLEIELSHTDPEYTYSALNTLIDVFIANSSKEKQLDSQQTYQFIDSKVQEYRRKLEVADRKLSEFQSRNTDGTEQAAVSRINTLRNQLEVLAIDIDEVKTRVRSIRRKLNDEQEYQKTKVKLAIFVEQRKGLQDNLDQLRLTYKDAYPEIISLKSKIDDIDQQISELQAVVPGSYSGENASEEVALFDELRSQLSEAEVSLEGMLQRRKSTESLLINEESRAKRIALSEAELTELTRDYNTINDIYQDFLKQRESADLSVSIDREGQGMIYQILERPIVPTAPSGLRALHFVMAGPVVGLLIPLALLVLYVFLDPRIRSENTLRIQLPESIELLGSVPAYTTRDSSGAISRADMLLLAIGALALLAYVYTAYIWIIS